MSRKEDENKLLQNRSNLDKKKYITETITHKISKYISQIKNLTQMVKLAFQYLYNYI